MADKVLWKTGDTITADKLNSSGIYSIPFGGTFEEITTPGTTAKDVLDAAKAGKLICLIRYEDGEDPYYNCIVVDTVTKEGTTVYMDYGQAQMEATYPDGIFTGVGGK